MSSFLKVNVALLVLNSSSYCQLEDEDSHCSPQIPSAAIDKCITVPFKAPDNSACTFQRCFQCATEVCGTARCQSDE